MAAIVLRLRLMSGDTVDVSYEDSEATDEDVLAYAVSTLAEPGGALRCRHGGRIFVVYARGVAAVEVAPRGAVL